MYYHVFMKSSQITARVREDGVLYIRAMLWLLLNNLRTQMVKSYESDKQTSALVIIFPFQLAELYLVIQCVVLPAPPPPLLVSCWDERDALPGIFLSCTNYSTDQSSPQSLCNSTQPQTQLQSSQTVSLLCQLAPLPSQKALLTRQTALLPSQKAPLRSQTVPLPSQLAPPPRQNVPLPSQMTPLPSHSTSLLARTHFYPTRVPFNSARPYFYPAKQHPYLAKPFFYPAKLHPYLDRQHLYPAKWHPYLDR